MFTPAPLPYAFAILLSGFGPATPPRRTFTRWKTSSARWWKRA